jgi:hypothetical protein
MPTNRPWEDVTEDSYFRGILGNIHHRGGLGPRAEIRVRFGITGDGTSPNYQLEGSNGQVYRFAGNGHELFHKDPTISFEPDRMSEETFGVEDIKQMIANCKVPRPKG